MQLFNAATLHEEGFDQILAFLRAGGVIGFPTDTAYGLGADPYNEAAVRRIFQIKRRPETKPILLLVDSIAMAESVASLSTEALGVAHRFWPGALTLILPAKPGVPPLVTAGTGKIAVRWPNADFALRVLRKWAQPITATSANVSGAPAAVTAKEVISQLGNDLEILIDGGTLPSPGGSTLLDMTGERPLLVREGPVALSDLREALKGNIR